MNHFYSLRWDSVDVENLKIALHQQRNKREKKIRRLEREKKKKDSKKYKVGNNTFYAEMGCH